MLDKLYEWGFFGTLGRIAFVAMLTAMALLCMHMEYEDLMNGVIH